MKKAILSYALVLSLCFAYAGTAAAEAPAKFEPAASAEADMLYPIWKDGKYGFINGEGETIIEPVYDGYGQEPGNPPYVVDKAGGKQIYYDANGSRLFDCPINRCSYWSDGMVLFGEQIELENGKNAVRYGYLNEKGERVIQPVYHVASHFKEGMARVNMGKASGYIDKTGKLVIPYRFSSTSDFSEGLAAVKLAVDGLYGYIDKTGKLAIPARFADAAPFSDGAARVYVNGKYGYIDREGKYILKPQFTSAGPFSEGLAFVERNGKSFYINKKGEKVIASANVLAGGTFVHGLAPASPGQKYGFIDKTGKYVVKPSLEWADSFRGKLAKVYVRTKETRPSYDDWYIEGYINTRGKLVWTSE